MFKLHKKGSAATEAIEYIVAGVELTPGVLVSFTSGKLVIATDAPEYVTLGSAKADELVAVKRIHEDETYETVLSVEGASLKLGDKVTIDSTGTAVTATTGGVFEIVEMDGTAVGSKVRGIIVK